MPLPNRTPVIQLTDRYNETIIVSVVVLHDSEPPSALQKQVLLPSEVNVWLVLHDGARFRCMKSSLHSSFAGNTMVQNSSEP